MSDYVRNKAVMYPITEEEYDSFYSKYGYAGRPEHFDVEIMIDAFGDCNYYLQYILYSTYGEESGDFGRARALFDAEQEKYTKLFEPVMTVDSSKLKYVDYCYYNCSEPEDYYKSSDDFYNEV